MIQKKKIPRSRKKSKAQTTVEYIILIALVAMLALKVGKNLQEKVNGLLGRVDKASTELDNLWDQ